MASGIVSTMSRSKQKSYNQQLDAMLLEGFFDANDARQHAFGILSKSMHHYLIQSFKHHENTGRSCVYSDAKMAELSRIRDDFNRLFDIAEEEGLKLDIEATLKVTVIPNGASEKICS